MTDTSRGQLMLVDDTPANLAVLDDLLTSQGYRVRCFPRGLMALAAAQREPPDLVLLDVLMPGMDGYEVCTRLKADPALAAVPVVFLSALDEPGSRQRGFRCGGADFVTKPFEVEEVLTRVETQLELRRLRQVQRQQQSRIDDAVRQAVRQVAASQEWLAVLDLAKGECIEWIAEELRASPDGMAEVAEWLLGAGPSDPAARVLKDRFRQSRDRLRARVEEALQLSRRDAREAGCARSGVPLDRILTGAAERAGRLARRRGVVLGVLPEAPGRVRADPELGVRAVQGLLETAVRLSLPGACIRLTVAPGAPGWVLGIEVPGCRLPSQALAGCLGVGEASEPSPPGGDPGRAALLARRILGLFGAGVRVGELAPAGGRFEVCFQEQAGEGLREWENAFPAPVLGAGCTDDSHR
jgi:CheY-like chemotaxis protein